jgi:hypothetical protein
VASTPHLGSAECLPAAPTFMQKLNADWHETAMRLFTVVVLAHWAEHLVQAYQVYVLHWPLPEARGVLGQWYPWLVKSELMHYAYALVMLVGLWMLRPGFTGVGRRWWDLALGIQFWHHIEHLLLQGQAIVGQNLFDSPVPISIAQLWIRRVELHLFYNTVVFVPMLFAMYHHLFPSRDDAQHMACSCAVKPRLASA